MIHINDLPLESFLEILSKADGCTIGICRRVSKSWKEIIDGTDLLWQECCKKEFKHSSIIARRKSGKDTSWYHIYKNLKTWSNISKIESKMREFYNFSLHDKCHALEIDNGILPLKDARGVVLYDMNTMKNIPVVVPEKNCLKVAHNDCASAILIKSGLLIQRSVSNPNFMSEAFFKADNFVLAENAMYFFNNRDIFKCDLGHENLSSKLILHCDYDIKVMQYNSNVLYIFTDCGNIVTIVNEQLDSVKPIAVPPEWLKQVKHITAINDKNYVCYSRILFKIETDTYKHLYIEFPPITALFFYGDIVLIGTKNSEILLYRLSSQKYKVTPIFERLGALPDGKYAVQLDVCERKSGPVIVAATFFEIFIFEYDFFPNDNVDRTKKTFTSNKLCIYKRLLRLKDRLQCQSFI
ncbi:uncharacterized protein LOC133531045 [Cydia pomonella]|uniref:uncharacterized protein LOC133531045 n=1 Tax=Cydia pomonella TaxID=82600 RepID=UPI002ADE57C2|nr:uncharacterized protein LOC133531045 [Cydia pomonella]